MSVRLQGAEANPAMAKPAVEAAEDLKSLHWDLRSKVGDWDPKCKNAGPCRVAGCGARPMQSPLTSDLSLRLSTWDSELTEACPQLAGECGGTWIASGATGGPVGRGPIFALDLAPCDDVGSPPSPTSPKVRIVPSVSKKLVLAYRNKESLVEEIIDLKRAVQDQQMHIQHHKIQASIIEMENRCVASYLFLQLFRSILGFLTGSLQRFFYMGFRAE